MPYASATCSAVSAMESTPYCALNFGFTKRQPGVETRAAQAIDRDAGHALGESGEQERHARDIAVVFARLIRTSQHHVVERVPIRVGMPRTQGPKRFCREVVRPDGRQRAAVPTE